MSVIPGGHPGFLAVAEAGASAPPAFTFIDSDAGSGAPTVAVNVPAAVIEGDLLVLATFGLRGAGDVSFSLESGWTQVLLSTADRDRIVVQVKVAETGDAGAALSTTNNSNSSEYNVVAAFRPDVPLASFTVHDTDSELTSAAPGNQTVTASAGPVPLVVLGVWAGSSLGEISPRGMSPAKDGERRAGPSSGSQMWLGWKIYNTAPSNVTVSMDDEYANNLLGSLYISGA